MTIVAVEASRRTASSIAIAAVGTKYGSVVRPAVAFSAIVAAMSRKLIEDQHVVSMPEALAEAPDPGEEHRDDEDRQQQPATEAGDVGRLFAQPEGIDLLHVARIDDVTDAGDDLTLADLDPDDLHRVGCPCPGRRRQAPRCTSNSG